MPATDLFGRRFGHLFVVDQVDSDSRGRARWKCECRGCGKLAVVRADNLLSGHTTSCGCQAPSGRRRGADRGPVRRFEFNGERLTLRAWAKRTSLPLKTLQQRITRGWPIDRALTTPTT